MHIKMCKLVYEPGNPGDSITQMQGISQHRAWLGDYIFRIEAFLRPGVKPRWCRYTRREEVRQDKTRREAEWSG